MTDQHRAAPEQWETLEHYVIAIPNPSIASCILELRDRIAALEAAASIGQPATPANTSAPADSLVERVASICASVSDDEPEVWKPEARAAIREVAAWLDTKGQHGCSLWLREEIELLDLEAKR